MKRGRRCIGSRVVAGINISIAAAFCACASVSDSYSFQQPHDYSYMHNSMAVTTQRQRRRPRPRLLCLQLMNNNNDNNERPPVPFVISGPTRRQDYEDVGRLLCEVFDDQADQAEVLALNASSKSSSGAGTAVMSNMLWNAGITKTAAQYLYTNRYISNARKMRGKKYALLVAKSFGASDKNDKNGNIKSNNNDNSRAIKPGQVIAMAEVGVSRYPILSDLIGGSSSSEDDRDETDVLASIGVICVAESQRRSGAASQLLETAESLARRRWNETSLYAAVEESNNDALRFFDAAGYEDSGLAVRAEVSERMRKGEMRPHILLQKRLRSDDALSH